MKYMDKKIKIEIEIAVLLLVIFVFVIFFAGFQEITYGKITQLITDFAKYHGLSGSFFVALLGSLWFLTIPYELIIGPLIKMSTYPLIALIIAAFGASLADIFNFYSGKKLGEVVIIKKIGKGNVSWINNFFSKWGAAILLFFGFIGFFSSYDLVALVVGAFSKMSFKKFYPITFAARILHFGVVFILIDLVIRII